MQAQNVCIKTESKSNEMFLSQKMDKMCEDITAGVIFKSDYDPEIKKHVKEFMGKH